jgi:hypothetical protein
VPGMLDEDDLLHDKTIAYYDPFFMDAFLLTNPLAAAELEIITKITLQMFIKKIYINSPGKTQTLNEDC